QSHASPTSSRYEQDCFVYSPRRSVMKDFLSKSMTILACGHLDPIKLAGAGAGLLLAIGIAAAALAGSYPQRSAQNVHNYMLQSTSPERSAPLWELKLVF